MLAETNKLPLHTSPMALLPGHMLLLLLHILLYLRHLLCAQRRSPTIPGHRPHIPWLLCPARVHQTLHLLRVHHLSVLHELLLLLGRGRTRMLLLLRL